MGSVLISTPAAAINIILVVDGVEGAMEDNVLAHLTIEAERTKRDLTENRVRRIYAMGKEEIETALKPFGFYNPNIVSTIRNDEDEWRIRYEIDAGEPVIVTAVNINLRGDGANHEVLVAAIEAFPLQTGDTANHQKYDTGKNQILKDALDNGYIDAKYLKSALTINPQTNQATIVLHLETGETYYFGDIRFQPVQIDNSLLQRFSHIKKGEIFSSVQLLNLRSALEGSEYFANVEIVPLRDQTVDYHVPIDINLTLAKPNKWDFGLGYGTDTGFRAKVGWTRRIIGSKGHKFDTQMTVSQVKLEFRAVYKIPIGNPRTDRLDIGAGIRDRETTTSHSIERVLANVGRHVKRNNWRESISLKFENTTFTVGSQSGTTFLTIPTISWLHVTADNPRYPRKGTRFNTELLGASANLGSDINLARAEIAAKGVLGLTAQGRVLVRANGGSLATSDFSSLPPSYRFFAGGDTSIRGYSYESQGPVDDSGNVIGGHHLVEASVEYDYNLNKNWIGAVFVDGGNAFDSVDNPPFVVGTGVGFRYKLPIGVIRADIAWAMSDPEKPWRLHVTLGPDL